MEQVQQSTVSAPLTVEVAKTKINLALTTQNLVLQTLQNDADAIVKNEDHLEEMKATIEKIKKGIKVIEDRHKEIKKPYLDNGKACDAAKNDLIGLFDGVLTPLQKKYNELCAAVAKRKADEIAKEQKKKDTLQLIENTAIEYSQKIAACFTTNDLLNVERAINLEKGGQKALKYGEFLEQARQRFDEILIPAITAQKEVIKKHTALQEKIKAAEDTGDVVKLDQLKEKEEEVQNEIVQNQLKVQESAIKAPAFYAPAQEASVIHASIPKGGRTDYEVEIVDLATAFKKCPELLDISLKLAEAKKKAREFDEAGVFDQENVKLVNGLKYTKKKTY